MTRRTIISRGLAALSFSLFAATVAAAAIGAPASAATGDGSDWGSDGTLTSDSAVTVRWDNAGNSASNTVPRDQTQVLPHTAAKTYADLDPGQAAAFADSFGGLQVSVSQTRDLTLQTVTISASGVTGANGWPTGRTLEVFQCWGDAAAEQPEPENCQYGVASGGSGDTTFARADAPYVIGADWQSLVWQDASGELTPTATEGDIPFRAIDGTAVPYRPAFNPYFSSQTTNELSYGSFALRADGTGERPFEIQTQAESQGLGCGVTPDTASTSRCWIVIVPKAGSGPLVGLSQRSALSTTLWANRLQVELGMADPGQVCGSGDSRTLLAGSEMLAPAMASWIPALCGSDNLALGYTILGDAQVRRELDGGRRQYAMLSIPPTANSIAVPVALAATVFAFRIDDGSTMAPVPQVKLNARLVAKLLTQSYVSGTDFISGTQRELKAPWTSEFMQSINEDPEFSELNGGLKVGVPDLIASISESDGARQVWSWILSDPKGSAFLSGCPDEAGHVINPFFSSRTYTGCRSQSAELDTVAAARIAATKSPSNYQYSTPVYPPDGAVFPQPGWYERDATTSPEVRFPLTLADLHARLTTLADVGRSVGRALYPQNATWCNAYFDVSCAPKPGKWKNDQVPAAYGQRRLIGVTDSATAARLRLQTALLCGSDDPTGQHCVGASADTLAAAASKFEPNAQGNLEPAKAADYSAGAYPLTLPIYGAVATKGLETTEAQSLAAIFQHFVADGQTPGFQAGDLPPGYVPLTDKLQTVATASLAKLAAWVPPVVTQPTVPAKVTPPTTVVPRKTTPKPTTQQTSPVAQTTNTPPPVELVAKVGTTPPAEIGFPQFGLVIGLAGAVLTGIASPIVGGTRRRRL